MVETDAEDTMEQMGTYLSENRETLGILAGLEEIELEIIAALDFFVDPPSPAESNSEDEGDSMVESHWTEAISKFVQGTCQAFVQDSNFISSK